MRCRFSRVFCIFTHRPYQPWLRLSGNFLCRVDCLPRERHRPTRTDHSADLGGSQGAAAVGKAAQGSAPRRAGPPLTRAYARMFWSGVHPSHSTSNSRLSQTSHFFTFWCFCAEVWMCLDSDCAPVDDSEQDLAPPEAPFPHGGGLGEDTPLLPRFLLQEIIFAHSPYEVIIPSSRAFRGIWCRTDWLCLRGIAATECAILPTRELAAYPRAARANTPAQGSAPRRVGPCRRRLLSANSAGGQIKCLGVWSSGRADSPVLWAYRQ